MNEENNDDTEESKYMNYTKINAQTIDSWIENGWRYYYPKYKM